MERETGIEPATSSLGSWHSTTELLPLVIAVTAEIVTLCFVLAEPATFPKSGLHTSSDGFSICLAPVLKQKPSCIMS